MRAIAADKSRLQLLTLSVHKSEESTGLELVGFGDTDFAGDEFFSGKSNTGYVINDVHP